MATVKCFEDLNCWKLAREVSREIGALCRQGAFKADGGLRDQIQRSSGSVMDNIAEGFDRGSRGEFVQFLGYAKGSAGEVKSQLYRALDNAFISQGCFEALTAKTAAASSTIKGLLVYLNASKVRGERYQKAEEPSTPYGLPSAEFFIENQPPLP